MISDGWFSELEVLWPGQKFSLKVEKVLYHERSEFQDILVFESSSYGRVLVLDGVIQLTERDEFAYQEMISHLPLFAHPDPKQVLIVGGGDGGVLREVARHACVESIDMCEIDSEVVNVARRFFWGSTASAYDDPRLSLIHDDAAKYLEALVTHDKSAVTEGHSPGAAAARRQRADWRGYDVIIVDSSDPVGPAETLFKPEFYEAMRAALAPRGVICAQGECAWLHLPLISKVVRACSAIFPTVDYAYASVPTYPSGQIGFILCSLDSAPNALVARRSPSDQLQAQLRYYNRAMHAAAFSLPQFVSVELDRARQSLDTPATA